MEAKSKSKATPAKKAATKKVAAKKVAAKKAAARKTMVEKVVGAKKVATKKVLSRKSTVEKAAGKRRPRAKKVAATTALTGRAAIRKAPARKVVAKKTGQARKSPARLATSLADHRRAQLDKTSKRKPVSRGIEVSPTLDVNVVLAEFFNLRQDEPLTKELAAAAAAELGVEVASLRAIAQVESAGSGFDAKGRPTILYERHVFGRNTDPKGKFNTQYPDISAAVPYAKGTFGNTEQQWIKLAQAFELDPEAALRAPSWGMFQILGENFRAAGFPDVRSFVAEMFRSPAGHLRALVGFIKANPSIHLGLKNRDWAAVALGYNGKGYKTYDYDNKLAAAYAKFRTG